VLVAHAACCPTGHAVLQFPDPADPDSKILFTARPDLALCESLPPCEAETVRLFVDGRSHAEIASHRGARPRTIANQLGSVFRKLEVSGRLELLRALACSNVAQQSSAWRVA